jgi:hypothetical protein
MSYITGTPAVPASTSQDLTPAAAGRRRRWPVVLIVCAVLFAAALFAASKGLGLKTHIMRLFKPEYGLTVPVVHFITSPVNNERDVRTHTALSFTIHVRNGTLDTSTLPKAHIELVPQGGGAAVPVILKPAGSDLLIVPLSAER